MLTADTATLARLDAATGGYAWLIELDFAAGTLRYTTWGDTLTATVEGTARTFDGLGNALAVGQVTASLDTDTSQVELSLSLANTAVLAAALGAVETYRNRPVRLYVQALDERGVIDGAAVRVWTGRMEPVRIDVDVDADTGTRRGVIRMPCSRLGMARARHNEGLRLSHQQHTRTYPSDRGLEYLADLVATPRPWLSVAFQRR